jgi:SHS2 domain-containing protein
MRIDESGGEKRVPAQMTDDQLYEHFSSTVNASFEKYYNTTSVPYSALVNIEETIERLEQSIADDIKETYVIPRTENPVDINAG